MLYRALIMLLWFVGTSVATVWIVFRDPTFKFRLVVLGALLPDLIDGVSGARMAHSVVSVVAAMTLVMAATFGRKPVRKAWLAVVIGLFLHLVFDFAFANTQMFWWPIGGFGFVDDALPVVSRGWWNAPLEVVGAVLAVWTSRQVAFAKSSQ
jgi:hypothetical protein